MILGHNNSHELSRSISPIILFLLRGFIFIFILFLFHRHLKHTIKRSNESGVIVQTYMLYSHKTFSRNVILNICVSPDKWEMMMLLLLHILPTQATVASHDGASPRATVAAYRLLPLGCDITFMRVCGDRPSTGNRTRTTHKLSP